MQGVGHPYPPLPPRIKEVLPPLWDILSRQDIFIIGGKDDLVGKRNRPAIIVNDLGIHAKLLFVEGLKERLSTLWGQGGRTVKFNNPFFFCRRDKIVERLADRLSRAESQRQ